MSKYIGIGVILLFIISAIVFFRTTTVKPTIKPAVTIDTHTFKVAIAKTYDEKVTGLSKKQTLPTDEGMIFLFDTPDYYEFWMKNMQFPLDIIYIHNNKIVTIVNDLQAPKGSENTNPPRFKPVEPAERVLEINAGLARKYHFKVGDSATISL